MFINPDGRLSGMQRIRDFTSATAGTPAALAIINARA